MELTENARYHLKVMMQEMANEGCGLDELAPEMMAVAEEIWKKEINQDQVIRKKNVEEIEDQLVKYIMSNPCRYPMLEFMSFYSFIAYLDNYSLLEEIAEGVIGMVDSELDRSYRSYKRDVEIGKFISKNDEILFPVRHKKI